MGWSRSRASAVLALVLAACPKGHGPLGGYATPPPDGAEIVCPVTHHRCVKGPETEAAVFEARTFYFCDPRDRTVFAENPERYAYR